MPDLNVRVLHDFVREVHGVTGRALELLDSTVAALRQEAELERWRKVGSEAGRLVDLLRGSAPTGSSTGEDLVLRLEMARDAVGAAYKLVSQRHLRAVNQIRSADEAGDIESYARLSTEMAELHEKLNTLAWLVGEHEADEDAKLPGIFSSADELFNAMGG